MITASALPRLSECPASAVLPQVRTPSSPDAERGTALHKFIETCLLEGREKALAEVPEAYRATAERIDPARFLRPGATVEVEVPLAYDPIANTTRRLPPGSHRSYDGLGPREIGGTLDLLEVSDEGVTVVDWKFGAVPVSVDSLQLKAYALMAARLLEVDSVTAVIVQFDEDGSARVERLTLDMFDLVVLWGELGRVLLAVEAAGVVVKEKRQPDLKTGDHCTYCQVIDCSSRTGLARGMLGELPSGIVDQMAAMSNEQFGALVAKALYVNPLWEKMWAGLKAEAARRGPVPLPDGRTYESKTFPMRSLDGKIALAVLREDYGPKADDMVKVTCTMTDLQKLDPENERHYLERIDAAGGLHVKLVSKNVVTGKARTA